VVDDIKILAAAFRTKQSYTNKSTKNISSIFIGRLKKGNSRTHGNASRNSSKYSSTVSNIASVSNTSSNSKITSATQAATGIASAVQSAT
jgi:hypothetical protein